jgi:hypothetical protein
MTASWQSMTNEDALRAWDAGEPIWTCDLGGMGPGYEQCIQLMGFEMLRAMLANPVDWDAVTGLDGRDAWRAYSDKIDADPAVKRVVSELQPSGAQHGAAMNIASVFAMHGYSKGMQLVPEDRRIQVSKNFPTLSGMAAAG